jgi:hypothetical protein
MCPMCVSINRSERINSSLDVFIQLLLTVRVPGAGGRCL